VSTNPHGPEETGLKMMKRGASLKEAARANHISQEKLRRYLRENTQTTRAGKVWMIVDLRRFHLSVPLQNSPKVPTENSPGRLR